VTVHRKESFGPVTLLLGDCREIMPILPKVDAIVTDPPYGQTSLTWDRWCDGWVSTAAQLVLPSGSMWVFGTLRMFMERRDDFVGLRMAQDIVWEKHNGSSFHADRFRRVHEQAAQFYRGEWAAVYKGKVVTMGAQRRTVRNKQRPPHMGHIDSVPYESEDGGPLLMRSVMYVRSEHGRAEHETQKPVGIVAPLIENCAPVGSLVLDPFMGSGTTLVAAIALGRRAIGIEANERYFDIACRRAEQAANQVDLFKTASVEASRKDTLAKEGGK
jgi:site-specific DNA-methyltransferase (adenine-specific)